MVARLAWLGVGLGLGLGLGSGLGLGFGQEGEPRVRGRIGLGLRLGLALGLAFLGRGAVHAQQDAAVVPLHPFPLAEALAHILQPHRALLRARGAIVPG